MARNGNHGIDPVRVALVVEHGRRRQQLRALLEEGRGVRYAFTAAGLSDLHGLRPPADVYLLDGTLLVTSEDLDAFVELIPADAALIIRMGDDPGEQTAALPPEPHGIGFISSESDGAETAAAIHAAFHGLFVWDPRLGPVPDGHASGTARSARELETSSLPPTRREAEVLEYVAAGAGNQEIARALGVSINTVKFHLSSLYAKLEVSNRTQALREAARRGYLML